MKKEKIIENIEALIDWHREQREENENNDNIEGAMFHAANVSAFKQALSLIKQLH